jgi:hypothetical protein
MRATIALLVTLSLTGCFPHSAKHRTYAKIGEGAALAAGIALLAVVNSGADCDEMRRPGDPSSDCRSTASLTSVVGVSLIMLGLGGFVATVSTTPDDEEDGKPANTLPPTPIVTPSASKPAPATPTSR